MLDFSIIFRKFGRNFVTVEDDVISNNGSLITEHYMSIDQEGISERIKHREYASVI